MRPTVQKIYPRVTKTPDVTATKAFTILFRPYPNEDTRFTGRKGVLSVTFVGEPQPTPYEVLDAFVLLDTDKVLSQDMKRRILAGQFTIHETVAVSRRTK